MKVLELFSGIGGMHFALKCSGAEAEVKAAVDINPVANSVYKHNFPEVTLLARNIQCLTPKYVNGLGVDTILMSPPCQPFTRNGLQGDVHDDRTKAFIHVLKILPELHVKNILVENVKGFEGSQMRALLVSALEECGFSYQEFILSPTQVGVPNSRHRYYCLGKKSPGRFKFEVGPLKSELPSFTNPDCFSITDILEDTDLEAFYIDDKVLNKYAKVLDICHCNSKSTCCFTKAYGRYMEGTGSVFTGASQDVIKGVFDCKAEDPEYFHRVQQLRLRFFTPREISRLMSFPEGFSFPEQVKTRQKYMLLGNSINVKVVSELIKLLK